MHPLDPDYPDYPRSISAVYPLKVVTSATPEPGFGVLDNLIAIRLNDRKTPLIDAIHIQQELNRRLTEQVELVQNTPPPFKVCTCPTAGIYDVGPVCLICNGMRPAVEEKNDAQ